MENELIKRLVYSMSKFLKFRYYTILVWDKKNKAWVYIGKQAKGPTKILKSWNIRKNTTMFRGLHLLNHGTVLLD